MRTQPVAALLLTLATCAGCGDDVPAGPPRVETPSADGRRYGIQITEGTTGVAELYRDAAARLAASDVRGARGLYQQASQLEPRNAQAHIGLGACALEENDLDGARAAYGRAIELDTRSSSAHIGLGSAEYLGSRYRESAEQFEAAIAIDDRSADAHWGAATAYEQLGDRTRMRAHAARFLELAPGSAIAPHARRMLAE